MRNKELRISMIKSFIARTPDNRKWLTEQYETFNTELKRQQKLNLD